jgi:hypothetical protein
MRALPVMMAIVLLVPIPGYFVLADEPPRIIAVEGPGNGTIENPLNISIDAVDPEGGNLTFVWYLDGERIGEGPRFIYSLFPGARNVTVIISDPMGNTMSRSWIFSAEPPPGWGDRPDNTRNRTIFWAIFGISGVVLVLVLTYILFRRK